MDLPLAPKGGRRAPIDDATLSPAVLAAQAPRNDVAVTSGRGTPVPATVLPAVIRRSHGALGTLGSLASPPTAVLDAVIRT